MKSTSIHDLFGVETDTRDWPVGLTDAEKQSIMAALELYLGEVSGPVSFYHIVDGVRGYTNVFHNRPLIDWQQAVIERALRQMGITPTYSLSDLASVVKRDPCVKCGNNLILTDIALGTCGYCQHMIGSKMEEPEEEEITTVEIALLWEGGQWDTGFYEVSQNRIDDEIANSHTFHATIEALMVEDGWLKDRNPVLWTIYNEGV